MVLLAVVLAGVIALGQSRFWPETECYDAPSTGTGTALSNAAAPPCSYQEAGHVETLAGAAMTHHYVRSRDLTWHVVTAGDRSRPVAVFLHGFPETWFAFHNQIADLSGDRFVVAPEPIVERSRKEFGIRGTASLARRSFATTDFDAELEDRLSTLFAAVSMPVLFLQGRLDPGQHPEEYARVTEAVADGYLEFVEAGHFLHLEAPDEVSRAIRSFLDPPHVDIRPWRRL